MAYRPTCTTLLMIICKSGGYFVTVVYMYYCLFSVHIGLKS